MLQHAERVYLRSRKSLFTFYSKNTLTRVKTLVLLLLFNYILILKLNLNNYLKLVLLCNSNHRRSFNSCPLP